METCLQFLYYATISASFNENFGYFKITDLVPAKMEV